MRLLIATGLYPPDIGGPATYTNMLERHLPSRGIELTVAPYGWVRRYPKPVRHLAYTWKLIRESKGCDALYALDPVSVGMPVYLVHLLTGRRYLLRVPGDYAWEQGQRRFGVTESLDDFLENTKKQSVFVRILKWTERRVAARAHAIIVPSAYMKGVVEKWDIDAEKITVIHSALVPLVVDKTREEVRTLFELKGTVLVTAARLEPWKGVGTVISILPRLKDAIGETTLVVVGEGSQKKKLEVQAEKLGIADSVRFVGRLQKDALGTVLKGADIFVLNSAYEGLSHQILEAMELGLPVVTTDVGGNPELITDSVNGLLVPYDDVDELLSALVRLATHDEFRGQVIQHARVRAKEFNEERVIDELVDTIRERLATYDAQE